MGERDHQKRYTARRTGVSLVVLFSIRHLPTVGIDYKQRGKAAKYPKGAIGSRKEVEDNLFELTLDRKKKAWFEQQSKELGNLGFNFLRFNTCINLSQ